MIIAATGHRPNKIGGYDRNNPIRQGIRLWMDKQLIALDATKAISGMALGVDTDFFDVAIRFDIDVIAAVPFKGQESKWPPRSQAEYAIRLAFATEVVYVCDEGYAAWKLQKRNEWMVDNCDILLAVWDGSDGGTANCVKYAQSVGKVIVRYDPTNGAVA